MTSSQGRLRVLVLDEYFPFPLDSGKPIRSWNLLKRLSSHHDLGLLCYSDPQRIPPPATPIEANMLAPLPQDEGFGLYFRLVLNLFSPYPYSVTKHHTHRYKQAVQAELRRQEYDLIQIEWTPYASYLEDIGGLPVIIASHNIESQIWYRRAAAAKNVLARWFFNLQAKKMETFEKQAFLRVDWVTTVSQPDAEVVKAWGQSRVSVVDNGVDLDFYRNIVGAGEDGNILFLASLDWQPNVDGLYYFLDSIWPLLLKREPGLRLAVAGRGPAAGLRARLAEASNVELAGEVPDVRPYLQKAAVIVVPLRIGGGSRLKILEAMAAGKAIVSTSVGAEGLAVNDSQHLRLADTPEVFASAVSELLSSQQFRHRLGENGRRLVQEKYSWDYCAEKLEKAWQNAVAAHPRRKTR